MIACGTIGIDYLLRTVGKVPRQTEGNYEPTWPFLGAFTLNHGHWSTTVRLPE